MSGLENKLIVQRYFEEVVNQGNLAEAGELVAAGYVNHSLARPDNGLEGLNCLKRRITYLRGAFPDVQVTVDDLIAEGDIVVARWTMRGTHRGILNEGTFNRLLPTGNDFIMTAISIFRLADGKITECWTERDRVGRLQQLGVVPPLDKLAAAMPGAVA